MDLLKRFIRPPALIGIGVGVVGVSALFAFRLIGQMMVIVLLLLLTIALLVVLWILLRQLRAARAADQIEKTISRQADRDIERSRVSGETGAEGMKAELMAAIEALNRSGTGRGGRGGRGALSKLPWYVLVGPPGAGKSTLIERSELSFPLLEERQRPRAVRGVGGTRSFGWWFSDEGVVLDLAGRRLAVSEFEDDEDWKDFLRMLREQRKPKPINGVIVAVALQQIADGSEAEVDRLAESVRVRLQDFVQSLGVVFPVYVVFTGCDRLSGFAEFFGGMDDAQRRQAWGATVPAERARAESAEALFDAEFEQLASVLSERRLARLSEIPDPVQRARVFAFPLQFERLRGGMRRFVQTLFEPDPREDSPLLRGFYLTSAAPGTDTVDLVAGPAAQALGLRLAAGPAPPPIAAGAWFVHDLLTGVVFRDAALATPSSRAEAGRRRRRLVMAGVLALVFLALVLALSVLSCINGEVVSRTRRAAVQVGTQVKPGQDLLQDVLLLDDLRAQVEKVQSLRSQRMLRVVPDASGRVLDPARRLYVDRSVQTVLAEAVRRMEGQLGQATFVTADSAMGREAFLPYFYLLRSWHLLTHTADLDPEDAPLVAREIRGVLESSVRGSSGAADLDRFRRAIEAQMVFLIGQKDLLTELSPGVSATDAEALEERGSLLVRRAWSDDAFYDELVREVEAEPLAKPLGLGDLARTAGALAGTDPIPGAYTAAGWNLVRDRVEARRRMIARDRIVGRAFPTVRPNLQRALLERYAQHYTAEWTGFLERLTWQIQDDPRAAAQAAKRAAKDDSQLLQLLQKVREQTAITAGVESPVDQVRADFAAADAFFQSTGEIAEGGKDAGGLGKVIRGVRSWTSREKSGAGAGGRSPKQVYQSLLENAAVEFEKLDDSGKRMEEIVASGRTGENALSRVRQFADDLAFDVPCAGAGPVRRLLTLPVDKLQGTIIQGGSTELAQSWTQTVVGFFDDKLASKYPFNKDGEPAVLDDFASFFGNGGVVDQYYEEKLKNYVSRDGRSKPDADANLVPGAVREYLGRVDAIRRSFFGSGSNGPGYVFWIRPNQPEDRQGHSANLLSVWISVGGERHTYDMGGREWVPLTWPGPNPEDGASLGAQGTEEFVQKGVWGIFKLLDQGRPDKSSDGTPQVRWDLARAEKPGRIAVTYDFQKIPPGQLLETAIPPRP